MGRFILGARAKGGSHSHVYPFPSPGWPASPVSGDPSETARRYTFSDGVGEVGFINPVSEPFCATCDRIRLTADGQLRTCLFPTVETDLRAVLRAGGDDEALAMTLRRAVWHKELKHFIGDKRF